jgi:hypothetical protein
MWVWVWVWVWVCAARLAVVGVLVVGCVPGLVTRDEEQLSTPLQAREGQIIGGPAQIGSRLAGGDALGRLGLGAGACEGGGGDGAALLQVPLVAEWGELASV